MTGKRRVRRVEEETEYDDEEVEEIEETTNTRIVAEPTAWKRFLGSVRDYIVKPFFYGAAGSFGVSFGYALYDVSALTIRNWAIIKAITGAGSAVTSVISSDK
ncbi:hypothetical protein PROFUN_04396 [Planoprotostelium fungivorum]|uniref:Uncharacterized protein n=1 Tax=Planoprotostelium fungivorum TaxID=1890364 RepID=A0A2P6NHW5_9EUKA|nr:hypothetical protein PROFUN_04396 [Planoprotostelium fungivorum]